MALRDIIELRESLQRAFAALFGTAVLVVITLTTLKTEDLDVALKSAVHFFLWSAALLGVYLILSVTGSLSFLKKPLFRRFFEYAVMGAGILTWLRGAYYVLLHYHVSGIEIVFMQFLIVTSIILVASDMNESVSGLSEFLVSAQKTLDVLKEVQSVLDDNLEVEKTGPAKGEPKPDAEEIGRS